MQTNKTYQLFSQTFLLGHFLQDYTILRPLSEVAWNVSSQLNMTRSRHFFLAHLSTRYDNKSCYTLFLLSVLSLAKSLQLILEISACQPIQMSQLSASRLVTNLIRLRAQCMTFNSDVKLCSMRCCVCRYFLQNNFYVKTVIIRIGLMWYPE